MERCNWALTARAGTGELESQARWKTPAASIIQLQSIVGVSALDYETDKWRNRGRVLLRLGLMRLSLVLAGAAPCEMIMVGGRKYLGTNRPR